MAVTRVLCISASLQTMRKSHGTWLVDVRIYELLWLIFCVGIGYILLRMYFRKVKKRNYSGTCTGAIVKGVKPLGWHVRDFIDTPCDCLFLKVGNEAVQRRAQRRKPWLIIATPCTMRSPRFIAKL